MGIQKILLDGGGGGGRISAGLARARLPKPAATTFHAISTCEVQARIDTLSLPTMLINWLCCLSKHSMSASCELVYSSLLISLAR